MLNNIVNNTVNNRCSTIVATCFINIATSWWFLRVDYILCRSADTSVSLRYVLYVALHEVYNFYIRASIEVYIKYLESDPDPISS